MTLDFIICQSHFLIYFVSLQKIFNMVIIGKKYGRLANRLWMFSYFISNSIEYNYKLVYRNFDEYINHFESTGKNKFLGYNIKTRLSQFIVLDYLLYWTSQLWIEIIQKWKPTGKSYKVYKIKKTGNGFDLNDSNFVNDALTKKVIIRDGGLFYRDNKNLVNHSEKLKFIFTPLKKYQTNILKLIRPIKEKNKLLIGVHLRKYDFRRFLGGKYFFHDSVYLSNMKILEEHFGENVCFLLCSDEPINKNYFKSTDFIVGSGHFIEDLYSFAQCDYLIGPPSSFTLWASFYGNVPLTFISPESKKINLSTFNIANKIDIIYEV